MNYTEAGIDLLLQNARQMLNIVRKTFPGLSFSEAETVEDCALARSPGEMLGCLWANAASLVGVPGQMDTAAALYALTLVCSKFIL